MSVEVKIGNDRSKDWCAVLRRFPHSMKSSSNWDTARAKHSTAQYSFIMSRWIMTLSFLRKTICSFFPSRKLLEHFFMFLFLLHVSPFLFFFYLLLVVFHLMHWLIYSRDVYLSISLPIGVNEFTKQKPCVCVFVYFFLRLCKQSELSTVATNWLKYPIHMLLIHVYWFQSRIATSDGREKERDGVKVN